MAVWQTRRPLTVHGRRTAETPGLDVAANLAAALPREPRPIIPARFALSLLTHQTIRFFSSTQSLVIQEAHVISLQTGIINDECVIILDTESCPAGPESRALPLHPSLEFLSTERPRRQRRPGRGRTPKTSERASGAGGGAVSVAVN